MLKNYNFILTILLYPFMLIIAYLILTNVLSSSFYIYLLFFMVIVFVLSFIISLYEILEDILSKNSKWRIILVILFSIFYIPFYYTKHIVKEEKYLGIIIPLLSVFLTYFTYVESIKKLETFFDSIYLNKTVLNEHYVYTSTNGLIRIDVDKSFRCVNNIGDYIISCDRLEDDSFIGVYYYDITDYSEAKTEDILNYHFEQILSTIEDSGYEYETDISDQIIKVYYNDMVILISQNNYIVSDSKYSLIIMKEVPKDLLNQKEFEKMIESITFLNYNNGVSS